MIQLNLLPDIKIEFLKKQRSRVQVITGAIILSLAAVGLTVFAALWVYAAQGLQKTLLTGDIKANVKKLQDIKDIDKYVTIQNQLASITALHDSKNNYSRLLDYLPSINTGVKLEGVNVDSVTKTLTFEGTTADYTTLLVFRDTLRGAKLHYIDVNNKQQETGLFTKVNIDSSGIGTNKDSTSTVSFKISTVYFDSAFSSTIQKPTITVPKKETTPSAEGAPTAVFGGGQ